MIRFMGYNLLRFPTNGRGGRYPPTGTSPAVSFHRTLLLAFTLQRVVPDFMKLLRLNPVAPPPAMPTNQGPVLKGDCVRADPLPDVVLQAAPARQSFREQVDSPPARRPSHSYLALSAVSKLTLRLFYERHF